MLKKYKLILFILTAVWVCPVNMFAMHIMEGFLPPVWSAAWSIIALPFILIGLYSIRKKIRLNPRIKILLGIAGAFVFVLSALKIPSVTGSSSHPTGVGLGAILFGPFAMSVIGCIVLLFQALLMAHGGLTTLGANTFSMAVIGPLAAFIVYKGLNKLQPKRWLSIFVAAFFGDLTTYIMTSIQLALAFPAADGGFTASFIKFCSVFAITQIPLAVCEGLLTVMIMNVLSRYYQDELHPLAVLKKEKLS